MLGHGKSLLKKYFNKNSKIYFVLRRVYKTTHMPSCFYSFIRSQGVVTRVFGRRYTRNPNFIEINITYRCNLACPNCLVSCGRGQAPSNEEMSVEQIQRFVQESINSGAKWHIIRVLGGEPTLHPEFTEILNILLEYKHSYSPKTIISVSTNGHGDKVNEILSKVPEEIVIINSSKESPTQLFYRFNMAPKDSVMYNYADYSNGCYVTSIVGSALTPYGYYPCPVAGGIDRVVGFNRGRKKLPEVNDLMLEELKMFCPLCGLFGCQRYTYDSLQSESWKIIYENYKLKKKLLSSY